MAWGIILRLVKGIWQGWGGSQHRSPFCILCISHKADHWCPHEPSSSAGMTSSSTVIVAFSPGDSEERTRRKWFRQASALKLLIKLDIKPHKKCSALINVLNYRPLMWKETVTYNHRKAVKQSLDVQHKKQIQLSTDFYRFKIMDRIAAILATIPNCVATAAKHEMSIWMPFILKMAPQIFGNWSKACL